MKNIVNASHSAVRRPVAGRAGLLLSRPADIAARLALTAPFLISGCLKLTDLDAAAGEVQALAGLQPAHAWAVVVIAVQLGGSALILASRRWSWLGAGLLAGFTVAATLLAHAYWTMGGIARVQNMNIFYEHVAICGGFMVLAIYDAGATARGMVGEQAA